MSKHLDQIKEMMLFDEPDFDEDEDEGEEEDEDEEEEKPTAKKNVETIVFRDPAKRRKAAKVEPPKATTDKTETEFDLEKARFDVYKFGIKGFDKQKYENARVSLAVSLGAKPPKRKFINYRELIEQNRTKKVQEKEEEENARLLGDLFQKNPNKKDQRPKSKQKRIGRGDVGAMRFSSVGKFQDGTLKLREQDISRVKTKSRGEGRRGGKRR